MTYELWFFLILVFLAGFLFGFGLCAYTNDRMRREFAKKRKQLDHAARRRYDTQENIGNRFTRVIRTYCSDRRFSVSAHQSPEGRYAINVWGPDDETLIISVRVVHLSPKGYQIFVTMGKNEEFQRSIDEHSIQLTIREIEAYLKSVV